MEPAILHNSDIARRSHLWQYIASLAVSVAVFVTGTFEGWISPAIPMLKSGTSPLPITDDEISWAVSLYFAGNLISPIPTGYMMNYFGRKATLLYFNSLPLVSWLLILFAHTPLALYLALLLGGMFCGIVHTLVPLYIAEIADADVRGSLSTFFEMTIYLGILFEYIVGPYVSFAVLAIISSIFPFVFFILFIFMPESPYHYIMKNNRIGARKSLVWLQGDHNNVDNELNHIEEAIKEEMKNKGRMKDLISTPGSRRAFLIGNMLLIFQRLSGVEPIMIYASTVLNVTSLGVLQPSELVIVFGITLFLSALVSTTLVDRIGRKILLIVSALGTGLSIMAAGTWFYLDTMTNIDVTLLNWMPFFFFVFFAFFYSVGLGPVAVTVKAEIFPTNVKGPASAVTTITGGLASFLMVKSFQTFTDHIGVFFNYWMYAFNCLIAVIFIHIFLFETKGKTLQEIQVHLNRIS